MRYNSGYTYFNRLCRGIFFGIPKIEKQEPKNCQILWPGRKMYDIGLDYLCLTYVLMLALQKYRPWIALGSAAIFIVLGIFKVYDFSIFTALAAVDYNVLLMIGGTMGIVTLFIESKMPARLAEMLISRVPNVKWAVTVLALFAGIISAFVDNVATVLMVAPGWTCHIQEAKNIPCSGVDSHCGFF